MCNIIINDETIKDLLINHFIKSLQSGKTFLANFISEAVNIDEVSVTRPTQGVRIVEFELSDLNVNGKRYNVDIELWDCSGDHRFFI